MKFQETGESHDIKIYDGGFEDLIADAKDIAAGGDTIWKREMLNDVTERPEWIGREFSDLDDYFKKATGVWEEGYEIVRKMLDDIDETKLPAPKCRRRTRRWSQDNGDEICYDRLRGGQNFWRETYRANASGPPTFTIIAHVGGNAGVTAQEMLWRATASVVLTNLLEAQGYRVDLWGGHHTINLKDYRADGNEVSTFYRVKAANHGLNIHSVIGGMSPWFFRTALFWAKCLGRSGSDYRDSSDYDALGCSANFTEDSLDLICHQKEQRINVENFYTREEAIKWVVKQVERINEDQSAVTA